MTWIDWSTQVYCSVCEKPRSRDTDVIIEAEEFKQAGRMRCKYCKYPVRTKPRNSNRKDIREKRRAKIKRY